MNKLEREFCDMDPVEYEETLRAFAHVVQLSCEALGETVSDHIQEVLDAPAGSLADEKRKWDEAQNDAT